jgi:hypothetical protein
MAPTMQLTTISAALNCFSVKRPSRTAAPSDPNDQSLSRLGKQPAANRLEASLLRALAGAAGRSSSFRRQD